MATWKETYVILAIAFDATLSNVPEDIAHLKEALLALINLTTIGDGSELGYGVEASADLLDQMNLLYKQARQHYSYNDWRNNMVRAINDFTILYYGDLDSFIDSLSWPDLCIPFYWEQLSSDSGADTSNWTVCS